MTDDGKLPPSAPAGHGHAPHGERAPAGLLRQHWRLFRDSRLREPVIDLACGAGRNGIFLASRGIATKLIDRSKSRLDLARCAAVQAGVRVDIVRMDLEGQAADPLPELSAAGILVFRYLHRPLISVINRALVPGGILLYETFTVHQAQFGKPRNSDHLLQPGELKARFGHWEVIHYFEGIKDTPKRAIAQIVCRKNA